MATGEEKYCKITRKFNESCDDNTRCDKTLNLLCTQRKCTCPIGDEW